MLFVLSYWFGSTVPLLTLFMCFYLLSSAVVSSCSRQFAVIFRVHSWSFFCVLCAFSRLLNPFTHSTRLILAQGRPFTFHLFSVAPLLIHEHQVRNHRVLYVGILVSVVQHSDLLAVEKVKTLLVPNLQREGRWARGAVALVFGGLAFVLIPFSRRLSLLLFLAAIFTVFEAVKGWCVLRACGIRTQV
jgi:hypothetical protein